MPKLNSPYNPRVWREHGVQFEHNQAAEALKQARQAVMDIEAALSRDDINPESGNWQVDIRWVAEYRSEK